MGPSRNSVAIFEHNPYRVARNAVELCPNVYLYKSKSLAADDHWERLGTGRCTSTNLVCTGDRCDEHDEYCEGLREHDFFIISR